MVYTAQTWYDSPSTLSPVSAARLGVMENGISAAHTAAEAAKSRATHIGTQTSTTISDFTEAVQDAVAALLSQGTNITLTYNDVSNTLTVAAGGGGGLDAEAVRDAIGVALLGTGNIAVTVNDALDTITVSTTATANSTDATLLARANHTGTQSADTVVDGTTNHVFTAADDTKLAGIATGATANSTNATLLARANHTGTQSADTITDGTTNHVFTAADDTKLTGVATGATVNSADATLLARANHTGTQAASTISDGVRTVAVTTGSETRPTTSGVVIWVGGSTQPTNITTGDVWLSGEASGRRVLSLSNQTTVAVNSDDYDMVVDTGVTGAITLSNPTGTPVLGRTLWYSLTGTASRAITYGSAFEDSTLTRPTTTSGTSPLDIGFRWNSATSKWRLVAVA